MSMSNSRPKVKMSVSAPTLTPTRAHPTDAGLDLRAGASERIGPLDTTLVGTGVRMEIPRDHMGIVALRSSMCKRGLSMPNGIGVIDADYRGEIKVSLYNTDDAATARVEYGERIAQLVIVPVLIPDIDFVPEGELEVTERGAGGFGSTGSY